MKLSAALYIKELPPEKILPHIAEAGFDGCALSWKAGYTPEYWRTLAVETPRQLGLEVDYVHAPYSRANHMWSAVESKWEKPMGLLMGSLQACAEAECSTLVVHTYIGFENSKPVGQAGIDHFGVLVREAEKLGVKIAFENTEGEPYLAALMGAFCHEKHVGFCFDSGHEACYNGGKDLLALYGSRLLCTHLNDNMGSHGPVSPQNDLHLLPFDGILNWENIASRLDAAGFGGMMNFELLAYSKPGRHENDKYAAMGACAYARLAYERACRVAALRKG